MVFLISIRKYISPTLLHNTGSGLGNCRHWQSPHGAELLQIRWTGKGQVIACSQHGCTEGGMKVAGCYLWCFLASEDSKLSPFWHLNTVIYLPQHTRKWESKDWGEDLSRTWA